MCLTKALDVHIPFRTLAAGRLRTLVELVHKTDGDVFHNLMRCRIFQKRLERSTRIAHEACCFLSRSETLLFDGGPSRCEPRPIVDIGSSLITSVVEDERWNASAIHPLAKSMCLFAWWWLFGPYLSASRSLSFPPAYPRISPVL